MRTFNVILRGEDRTEFATEVEARDEDSARREAEDLYPEASVLEVFDPREREAEIYRRATLLHDDPYAHDDYDWC